MLSTDKLSTSGGKLLTCNRRYHLNDVLSSLAGTYHQLLSYFLKYVVAVVGL